MNEDREPAPTISWPRALLTVAIITVVGIAVLVYGSNFLLTRVHRITRSGLVAIVTTAFFILLLALAWGLRRLQQRNVI